MIRALITAALIAGAAMHFFAAPPDVAIGYSLVLTFTLWFFWPLLRRLARLVRRRRHRLSRTPTRTAPTPHLTQINHHHHYYGGLPATPAAAMPRPDYSRPALPLRTEGQKAHDAIYDIIDIDDDTTR